MPWCFKTGRHRPGFTNNIMPISTGSAHYNMMSVCFGSLYFGMWTCFVWFYFVFVCVVFNVMDYAMSPDIINSRHTYFIFLFQRICFIPENMICSWYIHSRLTHWGRVTHICVGNLTSIDSDNGLSPERRQAITWTNAGLLLIGSLGTNFSEMLFGIQIHRSPMNSPHKGQWRRALMFSLICAWINS